MGVCERFSYKDVEGLRVGKFGYKVNTSCILYRLGDTLIDTGPPNQWVKVRKFIEERKPKKLLITHHHEDHSGNGGRIEKDFNPAIHIRSEGLRQVRKGFWLPAYRWLVWGKPVRCQAEPLPSQMSLSNGLILEGIHTPGHALDQTCFFEPNRGWLFSGDLFITAKPKFLRKIEDPNEEILSLNRVLALEFETLFCAHRGVVVDGKSALTAKRDFLQELKEKSLALHQQGLEVKEISRRLMGKEEWLYYFSMGDWAKSHFVEAFIGGKSVRSCRLGQSEKGSKKPR